MTAVQFAKIELSSTAHKAVGRQAGPSHKPDPEHDFLTQLLGEHQPTAQVASQDTLSMPLAKPTTKLDAKLEHATQISVDDLEDDDLEIPIEHAEPSVPALPQLFLPTEPLTHLEQTVMHDLIGTLKRHAPGSKHTLAALTPNVPIDPPLLPTANQRLEPDTLVAELPVIAKPTRQGLAVGQPAPQPAQIAAPGRPARGTEPRAVAIPGKPVAEPAEPSVADPAAKLQLLPAIAAPLASAMTPLEQAVHDLMLDARTDDDDHRKREPVEASPSMPTIAIGDVLDARPSKIDAKEIAGPREIAQPIDNQNHVHLVIDDGGERVVVTVAVRGDNVNVAMRSSDEGTAAALARNAGSLDHAMRGRGLNLAQLGSDHQREDPRQRQQREREQHARDRRAIEEFTLDLEVA